MVPWYVVRGWSLPKIPFGCVGCDWERFWLRRVVVGSGSGAVVLLCVLQLQAVQQQMHMLRCHDGT